METRAASQRRSLKVGLHLPEIERVASWSDQAAMCRLAEDVGFDSIWVPDHLLYRHPDREPTGPWECWSILSAVAAITRRVEIGPLVLCANFRNPALIAKMAATVDEISGGRLVLGLGAGWHEPEFAAYGFPFDHRVSRYEEALTIILGLLRAGSVDFEGRFCAARDCALRPRGPRREGPPLLIGTIGERMLRLAVRYADRWNAWPIRYGNRPEGLAELMARIDAACQEAGRDPATLERTVAVFVRLPNGEGPVNPAAPPLTGSPAELAAQLREFANEGISGVQVVLDPNTIDSVETFARTIELLDRD